MEITAPPNQVCILRAAAHEETLSPFANSIEGNHVVSLGTMAFTSSSLRFILPETDPGATFPWQYQRCQDGSTRIVEIAVVITGQGIIEVEEAEQEYQSHTFQEGDVVLIPSNILYRIRNTSVDRPLRAVVMFAHDVVSYWRDGTRA